MILVPVLSGWLALEQKGISRNTAVARCWAQELRRCCVCVCVCCVWCVVLCVVLCVVCCVLCVPLGPPHVSAARPRADAGVVV